MATPQGVGIQTKVYADKAKNAEAVPAEAVDRGVIILTCGTRGNVIRFLPPLTSSEEMLAEALTIIGDIIRRKS